MPNRTEVECMVSPGEEFHQTYTAAQVAAIATALDERAEFPYELTYLGGGSELWQAGEAASGGDAAVRGDQDSLLTRYAAELLDLAPTSRPVRVVDLGPGTARPVTGLLRHLLDRSRLEGYRGIDMSAELLALARGHLAAEFPDRADDFELRQGDFTGPDLAQVLTAADDPDRGGPVRFVVLAGGTLHNFADPGQVLRHVGAAMREEDVLVLTLRIDTGVDRPPFMDKVSVGGPYKPQQLAGLDLLGVDRSWYVPEIGYDRERSEVFVRVRFADPVAIEFTVDGQSKTVKFSAGDTATVWRYLYVGRDAIVDRLARNGFTVRRFEHGDTGQMVLVAATPSGSAA
jgi:L-histidine N-alpha-methyltransferase